MLSLHTKLVIHVPSSLVGNVALLTAGDADCGSEPAARLKLFVKPVNFDTQSLLWLLMWCSSYSSIVVWQTDTSAARWLALAGRSRTCAVQARRNSAPVSATQSPAVPDVLCYVSLEHHQQTATTLCQSSPTSCAALPTQLTWSSVLHCRWTHHIGIRCQLTSVIRHVVISLSDIHWKHSCSLSTSVSSALEVFLWRCAI